MIFTSCHRNLAEAVSIKVTRLGSRLAIESVSKTRQIEMTYANTC